METARVVCCCLLALLLLPCLPLAQCGQTLVNVNIARQGDQMNFTDLINKKSSSHDFPPTHVAELLRTMNNKPACHKVATHQLITFCKSIKEDTTNPRPSVEALEATKSIFAARLAICELREASASIPSQCKPLFSISLDISDGSTRNPLQLSSSAAEQVSSADLRACLRALEARPQSWTSYSNGRQDAALICDASRADIKKEEALELFSLLTTLGFELSQAIVDALQRVTSQQEAQMAFAEALKDLHTQQRQDLIKAHRENKAIIEESSNQLTKVVQHVSDTIRSAGVRSAADLKQMVETIFLSAATGGAELASIRIRDAEANHEVALALKEMVQGVANNDFAVLREYLRDIVDMADSAGNIIQAVKEDSSALQKVVQGSFITANQTAEKMRSVENSTLAAAQNMEATNALAEGMRQTIMEANQNFGPLKELFEPLAMFSRTVQTILSKGAPVFVAVFAMVVSVASISCCFGLQYGYYLAVGYVQAVAVALVVYFVPFSDWINLAMSNPLPTLSIFGMSAINGLLFNANFRHRLTCALRLRRRPQNARLAMFESSLPQQSRRQDQHRSRRAQTTPPRL